MPLLPPAKLRPILIEMVEVSEHAVWSAQRSINSALARGVSRFVYYSVMHPLRRAVRHHRLKLDAEEALIESGPPLHHRAAHALHAAPGIDLEQGA